MSRFVRAISRLRREVEELRPPGFSVDAPTWTRPAPRPSRFATFGDPSWIVPPCRVDGSGRVEVGTGVGLLEHASITIGPFGRLRIGDRVRLGRFATIACAVSVELGDDVAGSDLVGISDSTGPVPSRPGDPEPRPIVVGRGAYLGAGCVIGPGVRIGEGAYIGEGAVVLDDVPAHAVVRGNPAVVVE